MYTRIVTYCTHAIRFLASLYAITGSFYLLWDISQIGKAIGQETKSQSEQLSRSQNSARGYLFDAVASDEPQAALIGHDVLAAGGSAADAIVAMYFTLSVTLPSTAALGGGGTCLTHDSISDRTDILEFTAKPTSDRFQSGLTPIGIPSALRGMFKLHQRYGQANWSRLIKPAEDIARHGIPVSESLAKDLAIASQELFKDPKSRFIFSAPGGDPLKEGELLYQFDLARSLTSIRRHGIGDFYAGRVATALVQGSEQAGATLGHIHLQQTRAQWTRPIAVDIGDVVVLSSLPPTGGALTAIQIWSMINSINDNLQELTQIEQLHIFAESSMRAFLDRGSVLVSDGTSRGPADQLLAKHHLEKILLDYQLNRHTDPNKLSARAPLIPENPSATSLLASDKNGLSITCLFTLHNLFGIGRIAGETGIFLAAAPDKKGKGPQALAPLLVLDRKSRKLRLMAAATGGVAASSALAWLLQQLFFEEQSLERAIYMPRLHHGGVPDLILYEPGMPEEWLVGLKRKGHKISQTGSIGRISAFYCSSKAENGHKCYQSSDPRGTGIALSLTR